ncbi:putative disease resistance RPP13-like protein 3 [Sesamum alatum]|uniref:Disease resistance RPP13-like protein 3 n=1 Tax=Sesamum alatum TaxID=300844 RepID=A0AAE1YB85_9LAMI|nr:putative disease resistance RPP13-like protein 3 [Sesamum alatum]
MELSNPTLHEEDDAILSSRNDDLFGGEKSKIFGLEEDLVIPKEQLMGYSHRARDAASKLSQSLEWRVSAEDTGRGSRIMLTSRVEEVARHARNSFRYFIHKMRLLNEKESWHLLRERVFGKEHSCPPQLDEEVGKKIVKKCEGLPLAIIALGSHLSIVERTTEYWSNVECFIYIGVFPPDYDIPASKLIVVC